MAIGEKREFMRHEKRKANLMNLFSDFTRAWLSVREPIERGSGRMSHQILKKGKKLETLDKYGGIKP